MEKSSRKICLLLFLLAIIVVLTGCEEKTFTSGDIKGSKEDVTYHYEETSDPTNYVKIVTNKDKVILIELYPDIAPKTVENFQKLVSEKFYDNIIFHRVIEDFMIQTGDPEGTGMGGSKDKIKGEFTNNGFKNDLLHKKGIVSMARQSNNMDSASSQFFICVSDDLSSLDKDYATFGSVIAGYDVVEEISKVSTDVNDKPTKVQKMKTVRFVKVEKK